jgi:hypothetical protein
MLDTMLDTMYNFTNYYINKLYEVMNYDLILSQVKELSKKYNQFINKKIYTDLSHEEFTTKMEVDYNYLNTNNKSIFNKTIEGRIDLTIFSYMINKAKDIQKNKISNHDASVDVGQKLVDAFVKPNLPK